MKNECRACGGTGVYCGFCEPRGVGVVCLNCEGTGYKEVPYGTSGPAFEGRKRRTGVNTVRRSAGAFIPTGVGPVGTSVTYEEFLAGKMPQYPRQK